jgi:hypothetical protein
VGRRAFPLPAIFAPQLSRYAREGGVGDAPWEARPPLFATTTAAMSAVVPARAVRRAVAEEAAKRGDSEAAKLLGHSEKTLRGNYVGSAGEVATRWGECLDKMEKVAEESEEGEWTAEEENEGEGETSRRYATPVAAPCAPYIPALPYPHPCAPTPIRTQAQGAARHVPCGAMPLGGACAQRMAAAQRSARQCAARRRRREERMERRMQKEAEVGGSAARRVGWGRRVGGNAREGVGCAASRRRPAHRGVSY